MNYSIESFINYLNEDEYVYIAEEGIIDIIETGLLYAYKGLSKVINTIKEFCKKILMWISDFFRKIAGIKEIKITEIENKHLNHLISISQDISEIIFNEIEYGEEESFEIQLTQFKDIISILENDFSKPTIKQNINLLKSYINKFNDNMKRGTKLKATNKKNNKNYTYELKCFMWVNSRTIRALNRMLHRIIDNILYYSDNGNYLTKLDKSVNGKIIKKSAEKSLYGKDLKNIYEKAKAVKIPEGVNEFNKFIMKLFQISDSIDQIATLSLPMLKNESSLLLDSIDDNQIYDCIIAYYMKLKPKIVPTGSKLYHVSPIPLLNKLVPFYGGQNSNLIYTSPRVYFSAVPLTNQELLTQKDKILYIYEYTCEKPTKIYYDPEFTLEKYNQIGNDNYSNLNQLLQTRLSVYIETDKPLKVKYVDEDLYNY